MRERHDLAIRPVQDLSREERERIFAHGLHEEGVFYNRLNFFLVFESLLVAAAVSGFSGKEAPPLAITIPICTLGLFVSALWWYAQVNKLVLLKALEERVEQAFTEFRESVAIANERRHLHTWSANKILAHALPLTFMAAWIYILTYVSWLRL
jgi:hypothetical protein